VGVHGEYSICAGLSEMSTAKRRRQTASFEKKLLFAKKKLLFETTRPVTVIPPKGTETE
jgi:hypothetical protein